jgi:acyl carrier protein
MTRETTDIEMFIANWMKEQLEQEVDSDANFAAVGMDSLDAIRFTDDLAAFIGVDELPISLILDHPTGRDLAKHLGELINEATAA